MQELFIKERTYFKNVSPKTIVWYKQSFNAFSGALDSRQTILNRVAELRDRGLSSITVNTYLRAVNAYCMWLHKEQGRELIRIPKLKEEQKILAVFAAEHIKQILAFHPHGVNASRVHKPAMAAIYGASITGKIATGPDSGSKLTMAGDSQNERAEPFENRGSRCAVVSGFSVHAGVSIRARDRKGLERLCKYVSRPPVALDRLAQLPDGRLSYELKTPWQNGATHAIFEPLELLARLSALVPAPRVNLIHYYGVFGPPAKWRLSIVPAPCRDEENRNESDTYPATIPGRH